MRRVVFSSGILEHLCGLERERSVPITLEIMAPCVLLLAFYLHSAVDLPHCVSIPYREHRVTKDGSSRASKSSHDGAGDCGVLQVSAAPPNWL